MVLVMGANDVVNSAAQDQFFWIRENRGPKFGCKIQETVETGGISGPDIENGSVLISLQSFGICTFAPARNVHVMLVDPNPYFHH